jgi:membrane-bound lytic murein transglycosylase D
MRHIIFASWLFACLWATQVSGNSGPVFPVKDTLTVEHVYSDKEIRDRFKGMPSIVRKQYSDVTRQRIKGYVHTRRAHAERLLGQGAVYFPIIEQYLKQYNLPLDLRILPIIETNFDPMAVSRAGASGLWQFMEATARYFGLNTEEDHDERFDIHRSTEAAVQYLAYLYDKYDDWALALAAYNCGPRHVNRAIRRSNSRDYWTISRYLPRETQRYIPRFLAASYLVNYYHEHGLSPAFPDLDMQITADIALPLRLCLEELACIGGVDVHTLRKLNPAYQADCLAEMHQPISVTVPKRAAHFISGYLSMPEEGRIHFERHLASRKLDAHTTAYRYLSYTPDTTEQLTDIASFFNIEESLLRLWNGLPPDYTFDGETEIIVCLPIIEEFHLPKYGVRFLDKPGHVVTTLADTDERLLDIPQLMRYAVQPMAYDTYVLGFGESLKDLVRQYKHLEAEDIQEHNPKAVWTAGEIIRIPREDSMMASR